MSRRIITSCNIVLLAVLVIAEVPSYIHTCGRHDPKLSRCVENVVNELRPKLKAGIPDLGVPSIDNLIIDEVPLVHIKELSAIAHQVRLSGLSTFQIKSLKIDLAKQTVDFEVFLPRVTLKSDNIHVNLKLLVRVEQDGPLDGAAENVYAKVAMKFEKVQRKGQTRMYFSSVDCKLTVNDYAATFRPENPKKDPITESINSVVKESKSDIIVSLVPSLEKAIGNKVLEVSNQICTRFTYDELLPDRT